jgi:hypothetical protein
MQAIPPQEITLGQFTLVFISWGLLAVGALIWPEFTEALDLNRTRATIWATSILLIPALALYPFRSASQRTANLAHLFWTFAYLMFLLHAYWAIFVIFDGVRDTFAQMGILIAGMNFLLLGLVGPRGGAAVDRAERVAPHASFPASDARVHVPRLRTDANRAARRPGARARLRLCRCCGAGLGGALLGARPAQLRAAAGASVNRAPRAVRAWEPPTFEATGGCHEGFHDLDPRRLR